jgi:hypothetical protein
VPDALCLPHKNRGVLARAVRMAGSTPMCLDCFEGKAIIAPNRFFNAPAEEDFPLDQEVAVKAEQIRQPKKKEAHVGKFDNVNTVAMQNDRSDGMSVGDICKKHQVPIWFVYQKTKGSTNGAKPARAAKAAGGVRVSKVAVNGKPSTISGALEVLRTRRAEIDNAIAVLEGLT